jgi:hypothetical protein
MKPVSSDAMLLEIIGHLGAAKSQLLPSDDPIIAGHLIAAYDLAVMLRRAQTSEKLADPLLRAAIDSGRLVIVKG